MKKLTDKQKFDLHRKYMNQWLGNELCVHEYIAREGILNVLGMAWETISKDQQFKALVRAKNAIDQARQQLGNHSTEKIDPVNR